MLMVIIDKDRVRQEIRNYIGRKGQGALNDIATAADLTTQSVRRLRNDENVELETIEKVDEGLRALGWYEDPERPPIPRTKEEPGLYGKKSPRDVSVIYAQELILMAEKLESSGLDPIQKGQEFREFIANLHKTADAKVAAIQKVRKGDA